MACMAPMLVVGAWLGLAPHVVYHHYVAELGLTRSGALHDQRLAATIMWAGALPAFAVPALLRGMRRRRSATQPAWSRRSAPTTT
jgi:cytochrome c oxidase assembly factor CtaG